MSLRRILLTGGGTGGHIFPLVAIAQELRARGLTQHIAWAGRPQGMERDLVAGYAWPYYAVAATPLRRGEALGLPRAAWRNAAGVLQAVKLLGQLRPDLVIGSGGYVSAPVYAAARLRGIPYVLLESNAVLGVANRWFADGARAIFAAFPLRGKQPRAPLFVTGNPVRREFMTDTPAPLPDAWRGKPLLLVTGGSQGAAILNRCLAEQVDALHDAYPDLRLVLVAGTREAEALQQRLAGRDWLQVLPFTRELPALLRAASLVVSRAGAMTLCELAFCGVPAVLVPLPSAAEDHQSENARAFAADGRAMVVAQRPGDDAATVAALADALMRALSSATLTAMRTAAQSGAGHNPATAIADELARLFPDGV